MFLHSRILASLSSCDSLKNSGVIWQKQIYLTILVPGSSLGILGVANDLGGPSPDGDLLETFLAIESDILASVENIETGDVG